MKKVKFILFIAIAFTALSCKKGSDDPRQATERLLKPANWVISEILVNDAVTFSDGKMKQQFGGVDFERYMETVQFQKDGVFTGYFKGDPKPMTLKWRVNSPDILVGAVDSAAKGGDWTISINDVNEDSFSMKTQSTAYDYPRMTKIELKFKTEK
jgi:hypothetical protein